MKFLILACLFVSCNMAKILTDGDTDIDPDFFKGECVPDSATGETCQHETLYNNLEVFYNFEESMDRGRDISGKNLYLIDNNMVYSYQSGPNSSGAVDCGASTTINNLYSSNPSSNLNFGTSGNFTIAFWTYNNNAALSGSETLVSFESSGTTFDIGISGDLKLTLNLGGTPRKFPSALGVIPWKHFAFVVDRDNGVKFYQNGSEVHADTIPSVTDNLTSDNILLCANGILGSTTFFFNDSGLDNLGVWSRTLTDSEIKSLYEGSNSLNNQNNSSNQK